MISSLSPVGQRFVTGELGAPVLPWLDLTISVLRYILFIRGISGNISTAKNPCIQWLKASFAQPPYDFTFCNFNIYLSIPKPGHTMGAAEAAHGEAAGQGGAGRGGARREGRRRVVRWRDDRPFCSPAHRGQPFRVILSLEARTKQTRCKPNRGIR